MTDNTVPSGDCGSVHQAFAENFNGDTVPVGSFSDCDRNVDTADAYCGGLSDEYRTNWSAYPTGWYDTANPQNHSNGNDHTMGGEYGADKAVSVSPSGYDSTGTMKVDMYGRSPARTTTWPPWCRINAWTARTANTPSASR
ncbi:hypothetical protein [Streptomyces sp. B15]|uniref:hypothetical protein n=1 Tax=Streptomyces sp. B15 TaxID=1537797 RepID=UPI001B3804CB|nr:hypothetical protein [Streptomyces sp. B15]MBQ1124626.1 hypothetical protein [Streptomyces sp. B15]